MTPGEAEPFEWNAGRIGLVTMSFIVAVVVRLAVLPKFGLSYDIDQFVLWTHGLATGPFSRAYDQELSFPPVMVYIWGLLAAIEPGFRVATDSSDERIRILMKIPATLADFGLAAGVWYALRSRPGWAIAAGFAILLHPAVIDVGAWWGQYESIYTLAGVVAFVLAMHGRPGWAAVALAVALMAKPQALPFAVPFAAWYLARFGLLGSLRYVAVGVATIIVLWLPFVAAGGPGNYLRYLGAYQNELFAILSLRAWNAWWILQSTVGGPEFVSDATTVAFGMTFRVLGYLIVGVLEAIVFLAVYRAPTPRSLALGLAASTLVAFTFLTTMHERYAFAALPFLALLLPDRRVRAVFVAFGIALTLNLFAASPPTRLIREVLPVWGPIGIVCSIVVIAATLATLALLAREADVEKRAVRSEPLALANSPAP